MKYRTRAQLIRAVQVSLFLAAGGAGGYFGGLKAPQLAQHLPVSTSPVGLFPKRDALAGATFLGWSIGGTLGVALAGGIIVAIRPRRRPGGIRFSSSLRR